MTDSEMALHMMNRIGSVETGTPKDRVIEVLQQHGQLSAGDIAVRINLSYNHVIANLMPKLIQKGIVARRRRSKQGGSWHYYLVD